MNEWMIEMNEWEKRVEIKTTKTMDMIESIWVKVEIFSLKLMLEVWGKLCMKLQLCIHKELINSNKQLIKVMEEIENLKTTWQPPIVMIWVNIKRLHQKVNIISNKLQHLNAFATNLLSWRLHLTCCQEFSDWKKVCANGKPTNCVNSKTGSSPKLNRKAKSNAYHALCRIKYEKTYVRHVWLQW